MLRKEKKKAEKKTYHRKKSCPTKARVVNKKGGKSVRIVSEGDERS